jgi:hypothetical protein
MTTASHATGLTFYVTKTAVPATDEQKKAEYEAILKETKGKVASWYKSKATLFMKPADIDALTKSVASFLLAVLASAACGPASTEVPPRTAADARDDPPVPSEYPVTWQASLLELSGPQPPGGSPQRVLEARLSQEWDDGLQLTNGQRTLDVRSCRSLLDLDGTYETLVPSEYNVYLDLEAECRAAALLVRGQPSKSSFLHDFALDAQAPNRLPARLAFTVSPEDDERVARATARGEPWSAVEDVHLAAQASSGEARYEANASEQTLTVLGQGDVNGDGFEDLLLLSRGRLTEGSLKSTRLLVLTQESAEARVMRSVPVDQR